jgi:hypothetical protein
VDFHGDPHRHNLLPLSHIGIGFAPVL